jgi:hypothetical protein
MVTHILVSYHTMQHYNPEDFNLNLYCSVNVSITLSTLFTYQRLMICVPVIYMEVKCEKEFKCVGSQKQDFRTITRKLYLTV